MVFFAGVGIGLLALVKNLALSIGLLIFSASCGGIAISFIVAGLQHYSSDEHRSRVMSFYTIIGQGIPAASGVGAGLLAQSFSPVIAMVVASSVIVITLLIALIFLKQVRQLESYT